MRRIAEQNLAVSDLFFGDGWLEFRTNLITGARVMPGEGVPGSIPIALSDSVASWRAASLGNELEGVVSVALVEPVGSGAPHLP